MCEVNQALSGGRKIYFHKNTIFLMDFQSFFHSSIFCRVGIVKTRESLIYTVAILLSIKLHKIILIVQFQ